MKILILEGLHGNNKGKKMQWRLKRTNLKVGDSVVLDCHDWEIIKVVEEKKKKEPKGMIYNEITSTRKKALAELCNRPYFKTIVTEVKGKSSRGENLEKIKFPCHCTHNAKTNGYSGEGMIITCLGGSINPEYTLIDTGKQRNELTTVASNSSLKKLIEIWDIEIVKGEIHLWREVG